MLVWCVQLCYVDFVSLRFVVYVDVLISVCVVVVCLLRVLSCLFGLI